MAKNTRKFPKKDGEEAKETIRKLKSQIRKLQKKIRELKSEIATMEEAWLKTETYLSEIVKDVPLEDLLQQEKILDKTLVEDHEEDVRDKWARWRKENL